MSVVLNDLAGFALQYGYPGVFVISVLGSAVPFLPLPYLAVVVILSSTLDPLWLGVFAGIGGAIGKVTSYLLGRGGYVLTNEETRRNLDALHGFMAKYGAFGVFFFSITPLPDDVYIVPMGMIKLPFWRFFTANLAGKITLSVFVAYASRAYFSEVSTLFGGESTLALIAAISVTVILSLILLRADWILAVRVAKARGLAGLIRSFPAILRKKKENSREE